MEFNSKTPERTFELGREIGAELAGGEMILLSGGLGAGKTLFTKGILDALGYDVDEVTSPSFTLVNLYRTDRFDVYHIDLWRIESGDAAFAVGLDEILDGVSNVVIIEWAEKLGEHSVANKKVTISIEGEGDDPRVFTIDSLELRARGGVE